MYIIVVEDFINSFFKFLLNFRLGIFTFKVLTGKPGGKQARDALFILLAKTIIKDKV